MTRLRKRILKVLSVVTALFLLLVFAVVMIIRSQWFYDKVRLRLVETVETATGGRVEIGKFSFDWHRLRAEVTGFTLHGTEPEGKPPLFHADSVAVGLKIISLVRRDVDIAYLDVITPQVYLVIDENGRTNVPEPRVPHKPGKPAIQTILDLAIGRFSLQDGQFEIESRGKTPFSAAGDNLNARFNYDLAGPRYLGDLSIEPLKVVAGSYRPLPSSIATKLTIEANRITINSAHLAFGASSVNLSGAIEDLVAPHGAFQFDAHVSVQEATPILRIPELRRGDMQLKGNATFKGSDDFFVASTLHGTGLEYRDPSVHFVGFRADGALTAGPKGIDASGLRLLGNYVTARGTAPVEARINSVAVRGKDLDLRGITASAFGGAFKGDAKVLDLTRYSATGDIANIEARPVVAMYIPDHLPWNTLAAGPVSVSGSFKESAVLVASATLNLTPASDSAPVHGQIVATFRAKDHSVDLGTSSVTLPSSQVDFSGILGQQLQVHLNTHDLDDLLPAIGEHAANLPVKLTGSLVFDGTVSGTIDQPQIKGRTHVTGMSYMGETFDSVDTDADVSPAGVHLQNGTVAQGPVRAQFQVNLALADWKTSDSMPISGTGTVSGATVAELAKLLDIKTMPVVGVASGTGTISGTLGDPHVSADFQLTKGSIWDEPFDRFNGHLNYTATVIELTGGQLNAGSGLATVSALYRHQPGHFDSGHLQMKASTNARPLEQIKTLHGQIDGLKGSVEFTADAEADLSPPKAGSDVPTIKLTTLNADVTGHNLQLSEQTLGDAHLTARSQGGTVYAHVESNVANSDVRGDAEIRLTGDYPGTATFSFAKLDLAQLRAWLQPATSGQASPFVGSAEGELRIEGPFLQRQQLKAELRIPKFEFGPPPDSGLPNEKLMLRNSGPIVADLANNVITVQSARLTGAATDVSITGRILMQPKPALDLRGAGKIDLALVHDFNRDFTASGAVAVDATARGSLDAPQVNGRAEFQKASFNIEDVPNGISNATGVLIFTADAVNGTRATIQSFTGETGGGKIELTGFAGLTGGQSIFRLHARATQVRVRYPEGVSTVADANLNLTGTTERSSLDGTITIVRVGFNPQSDFSSLLGKSAQPVQTPAARTGLLSAMNFDIQILTSSDVQFQSSLTQDVQMEANLRLKGTFSNPAVLGRINITQGQMVFFGTKYTINDGSIQFYNPLRIDPILDIDLETKANGIDVTLNVSGPFNKPNLTPRSDPPLQFNEIVALLATGRSPTSDPTRLAQESTAPGSWQQMGASALLGQALASPVAGRLQRFFGVSQLRIDPTLSGVENNPQARVSLEQQVTPDITFTYITDVTNSNPQVVRVEWAFSKKWSVVALREENGLFGMDFFYKKRF